MVTAAMSTDPLAGAAAADLEQAELALSEAARNGGATWAQIVAAMGASGRQGAQKRHADLSRSYPRPPEVDNAATVTRVAQPAAVPATAVPEREPARKPADRPGPARAPLRGAAAEDHARDHPRAPVRAGESTGPRRVPGVARDGRPQARGPGPPHLAGRRDRPRPGSG